jgi:hypothetical protein
LGNTLVDADRRQHDRAGGGKKGGGGFSSVQKSSLYSLFSSPYALHTEILHSVQDDRRGVKVREQESICYNSL